jgi:RNA polymerase sigma-70 factor (ECF subfamily)
MDMRGAATERSADSGGLAAGRGARGPEGQPVAGTPADGTPAGAGAPSAPGEDDAALVARMSAGDERALGALYDRWSSAAYSLAVHVVRDPGEAEDVVEDTFWQAWRQAARYEPTRGGVSTWLMTIARSRALDRLRALRRSREEVVPLSPAAEAVAADAATPAAAAELSERATLVAAALQELPREQREALELAYYGGLSQTEIAERTGQPLGTVKTRMRLAMQKLRGRLMVLGGSGA